MKCIKAKITEITLNLLLKEVLTLYLRVPILRYPGISEGERFFKHISGRRFN